MFKSSHLLLLLVVIFVLIWLTLMYSVFINKNSSPILLSEKGIKVNNNLSKKQFQNSISEEENDAVVDNPMVEDVKISSSLRTSTTATGQHHDETVILPNYSNGLNGKKHNVNPNNVYPLHEVERNITLYLRTLHQRLSSIAGPSVNAELVWETYLDVTKTLPMTWDKINVYRHPQPRNDGSIFVSLGTYRDPFCPMTIKSLFNKAAAPEKLFVGLFQQNCFAKKCRTGVLKGGKVEDAGTDMDCYYEFCNSPEGIKSNACNTGQIRLFNVNESESLGPYMARYLGSKFYRGEQFYLQIDSHSEFTENWDKKLLKMVRDAPAEKPVISTYPPDSTSRWKDSIGYRMCDSEFAKAQIEWQIIRLGSSMAFDRSIPSIPKYAPFVAAGFFFGPAMLLQEVPFDPFLPWIFMGEEISMSVRLWTAGYDIFSPTVNVLNHYYVRRHYPKFWESVNRSFKKPIHNDIVELIIKRVKSMLGYPESRADRVSPSSLLYRLDDWSMGTKRSASQYMKMVGIDPMTKTITSNKWCHAGEWPEIAKQYMLVNTKNKFQEVK